MATLENLNQRLSYILGENMAKQMQADGIDIDVEALAQAVTDVYSGNPSALTLEQKEKTVEDIQKLLQTEEACNDEEGSCSTGCCS